MRDVRRFAVPFSFRIIATFQRTLLPAGTLPLKIGGHLARPELLGCPGASLDVGPSPGPGDDDPSGDRVLDDEGSLVSDVLLDVEEIGFLVEEVILDVDLLLFLVLSWSCAGGY